MTFDFQVSERDKNLRVDVQFLQKLKKYHKLKFLRKMIQYRLKKFTELGKLLSPRPNIRGGGQLLKLITPLLSECIENQNTMA